MPSAPAPGGVTYHQALILIKGLCRKARLVGMDIAEIAPSRDLSDITSITAGYLILNAIGAAVRARQFERKN